MLWISYESLSLFLEILKFKAEEVGKWVIKVNPAYTSQDCSRCYKRTLVKLELKDRTFICVFCGLVLDRDINSARNILYKTQITDFGTNFARQIHTG